MASIRKRGPYQWQCRVTKNGVSESKTFNTKAEAEAWAAVIESEIVRGVYVSYSEAESTTLKEAFERYAREIFPTRKDGGRRQANLMKRWLEHSLAKRSLASIRPTDVAAYRDARLKEVSPNTVRLELSLLSHLFTIAVQEWDIGGITNPVKNIRKPKLPPGRDRRLVGDEEHRLLEACAASRSNALQDIVIVAIETAMRLTELLELHWSEVDLQKHIAHVHDGKTGDRDVPLSTRAVEVLRRQPRSIQEKRVFFEWKNAWGFENSWRRALQRAKIKGLRFHDLRHEATSRFFEKGLNPMQVSTITGHKTLAMLKRYTHLKAEDLAEMLG